VGVAVVVVTSPCMAPELCVVVCVQRQHAVRARMDGGGHECLAVRGMAVGEWLSWE
jgi:hypothetical protein